MNYKFFDMNDKIYIQKFSLMQYIINQEIFYTLSYNEENTMKIAICDDNEAELN